MFESPAQHLGRQFVVTGLKREGLEEVSVDVAP